MTRTCCASSPFLPGGGASNANGDLRIQLGFYGGSVYTQSTAYNISVDAGYDRTTLMCGSPKTAIPVAERGSRGVPIRIEGRKTAGNDSLTVDTSCMVSLEVEFINDLESNV